MNGGAQLPGDELGSARIRRCSGIVVLIPSIVVISSVRFHARDRFGRSRPWTISLAIIES
jgi:hypothetical protein